MPPEAESPTPTCPQCGGPLDPTLPGGGCGACLWGDLILGAQEEQQQGRRGPEIPGYEIKEEIGRGGMGVVFLARQESSGREVALKMVAPDTLRELEARQRFLVEVEAMAAVQHPALIPLYDAGQDAYGRPWLAMQYAAGGTLAARLGGYSRQWRLCAELLVTLARAVAYAHERGVLHRDLKPANILFDAAGHPYVADFGLAKWADEDGSVTRTASVLGSPAYLAPEAAASGSKATTTVSDVYGLGAILYELLCGARPYEGASAPEIITRIRDHAPAAPRAKLPDIPLDLEVIVLKAMAREPGQRYASAAALADDLQRWLDGLPILARPLGPLGRLLSWSRRKPALAALSGLLAGSVITGGVMVWRESQRRAVAQAQAEERVDFMIRDLPGRLAPLGRLDLLDRVFENVAGYYREAPATDAAGLAREADFLTGWAQILRPRGQTLAAVERLRDAMDKARTATARPGAPREAIHARINTGRRLAEALIEAREYDAALAILEESTTFAKAHPASHLTYRILLADLEMERYFLFWKQEKEAEALPHAEAALRLREAYQPELEQPPATPEKMEALLEILNAWMALIETHTRMENATATRQRLDGFSALVDRLLTLMPDDAGVRFYSANRWLAFADHYSDDPQAALDYFAKAETEAVSLLARDATNVAWRQCAVHAASRLENLHWKAGNEPARLAARSRMAERMEYLYSANITDTHFLLHIREEAVQCGDKHQGDDWPTARHHYTQAIKAQWRLARLTGGKEEESRFGRARQRIADKVAEHEGREAADAWTREVESWK